MIGPGERVGWKIRQFGIVVSGCSAGTGTIISSAR
jgi:hypothetical protein